MRYISSIVLAGASLWFAGCASAPKIAVVQPVGPAPGGAALVSGDGSLKIFSARVEAPIDVNEDTWLWNNDFGKNEFMHPPAHTDYTIYAQDGHVVRHVANANSPEDATPALVTLPPGSYKVEAEADCGGVREHVMVPVLIKPGQTTVAHLEGDWAPRAYSETEMAKLPCGRLIGWLAPRPEAGGELQR